MIEMIELTAQRDYDRIATALINAANQRIDKAAKTALPEWKDMCTDLDRWMNNWTKAVEDIQSIKLETVEELRNEGVLASRRIGGMTLSVQSPVHQMALTVATQRMALEGKVVYDLTIEQLYTTPMNEASARLRTNDPLPAGEAVPALDPDNLTQAVIMSFMELNLQIQTDPSVGLSLGLIGVEFKPRTCEFKLQIGQGLILADTWSPAKGFGMQTGVGFEMEFGMLKVGASEVVKFGSDGSIEVEGSGVAGMSTPLGGAYGVEVRTTLVPKQHEPTGTSDWIKAQARELGCDVS
jgi:hypothetical protein